MATSSGQAGYLSPQASPVYDDPLDLVFHDLLVGITGITGDLVRPRWQPEPPQQPDFGTSWVGFGVTGVEIDKYAYTRHDPAANAGAGGEVVERDETLTVTMSFYGPVAMALAMRAGDAFQLGQNRAALLAAGCSLLHIQTATPVPALLREKWVKRWDVQVLVRRRTQRTYAVNTITSGQLGIDNEIYVTPINTP